MRDQVDEQRRAFDQRFEEGGRDLVGSRDPLVRYLTRWRMQAAWSRLIGIAPDLSGNPSVLFLCAVDAGEATTLADLGVSDITITDISENAVRAAIDADPRLRGFAADAVETELPGSSYDVVIVQDGLHHLPEPVSGFTEMLRLSRRAAFFLEGADSPAGRRFGLEWEVNGEHVNYVFRWNRRMVDQVAKAYLGPDSFTNASWSFWHHNVRLEGIGRRIGGGQQAVERIARAKSVADRLWPAGGNQFCGMVVKKG